MKNIAKLSLAIAIGIGSLTSCSNKAKDELLVDKDGVHVDIEVIEQSNMSYYDIQSAQVAKDYISVDKFNASQNVQETYNRVIPIEKVFGNSDKVNIRVLMVDKDGKTEEYIKTYWVNRP